MNAAEYFPHHYRADLRFFSQSEVPRNGSFSVLCGWTLVHVFLPENTEKYADPASFLCVLYELNLLNQAIYTYFPADHGRWLRSCEPFPDTRNCGWGHGGMSHDPGSILRFSENPFGIADARPLSISNEKLNEYTNYFFGEVLRSECERMTFWTLRPETLIERLMSDNDCPEFSKYFATP
jgi:hypothetical protein